MPTELIAAALDHRDNGPQSRAFYDSSRYDWAGAHILAAEGATLRRLIEEYLRNLLEKNGYQFVSRRM